MKALLLKDFYLLRRYGKTYTIMLLLYGVFAYFTKNVFFITGVSAGLMAVLPFTTFTCDKECNWNGYALTAPVSRRTFAVEKYIMVLGILAVGELVTMVVVGIVYLIAPDIISWGEITGTMIGVLIMGIFNNSITIPAVIKFGPEKGRFFMIGGLLLPMAILVPVVKLLPDSFSFYSVMLGGAGILLIMFIGSILLSVHLCEKLEAN